MATNTSYLNLSLLGIGEAVGTWGVSLNANFQKLDILAGEVISARGSEASISGRFSLTENEIGQARGSFSTLNQRLGVLLLENGTLNVNNFPKAGTTGLGIVKTSVMPEDANAPVVIGENDPRVFTTIQKDNLVNGNVTNIHKHNLVDGAADLTVSAVELNQLDGINQSVNADNLNKLVSGESTALHNHDELYYTEIEIDQITQTVAQNAATSLNNHNASDLAHSGSNLSLGNLTSKSLTIGDAGKSIALRANIGDANGAIKFELKNKSGVVSTSISENGILSTKVLDTESLTVSGQSTVSGNIVGNSNLTVERNAIIGTSSATDLLTVNANSNFNGTVNINGGIVVSGNVTAPNITSIKNTLDSWIARNDNPSGVTLTQVIDADSGTNITVAELESLTDGSSADILHTHAKYDTELAAARNSAIFGSYASVDLRLNNTDTELNSIKTEVQNARDTFPSIDARLDSISLTVANNQTTLGSRLTLVEGDISASNVIIENNTDRIAIAESGIINATSRISLTETNITSLDSRLDVAELAIVNNRSELLAEVADARGDIAGNIATVNSALSTQIGAVTTEVNNARGTAANLSARLAEIAGAIDSTHEARIISVENEIVLAKSTFSTVDGRFDALEAELVGAKDTFPSINARLINIANVIQSNLDTVESRVQDSEIDILAIQSDIDSLELEMVNARGGKVSVKERLDEVDTKIATFGKKFVYSGVSATNHTVTHNLNNRYPNITIWDTATNEPITNATISATSNNELTITLGVATTISVILIG